MKNDPITRERAARFKRELDGLGLKQAEFAREIDMSPNTVSRWATGWQQAPGIVWAYLRLRREAKSCCEATK